MIVKFLKSATFTEENIYIKRVNEKSETED